MNNWALVEEESFRVSLGRIIADSREADEALEGLILQLSVFAGDEPELPTTALRYSRVLYPKRGIVIVIWFTLNGESVHLQEASAYPMAEDS